MIKDSQKFEAEDKAIKDRIDTKNQFENYIYQMKNSIDDKQKLAKSSGLPSVGWVEHLYIKGTKLLADLNYIPEKVFKLIKSKAYRKVSCEIYWNLTVEGNKYSRVCSFICISFNITFI